MSRVFLTSDLHLGHQKVSELRGFESVEEHDAAVIGRLAQAVSPGDTLWVLGDISAGGSAAQRGALDTLRRLLSGMGVTAHLVSGNHDGTFGMNRKSHVWLPEYLEVFATVQAFARRKVAGKYVWLSHFPWHGAGDREDVERFSEVRLHDDGRSWVAHGHLHVPERHTGERMLHVGLDAWGLRPVSLEELTEEVGRC